MADEIYGKGIKITSGFDLSAKTPLDSRSVVNTIEERDTHVKENRAYIGMKVYVLDELKEYIYNGDDWEEVNTNEKLEKIVSSNTQPTEDNVTLWVNTSEDETTTVTRINDETVADNTTWSSEKVNNLFNSLRLVKEDNTIKLMLGDIELSNIDI